jgi:hypothetical protein
MLRIALMGVFARLQGIIEELRTAEAIRVTNCQIETAVAPVDEDLENELRDECEAFSLDDDIRAVWSEIDGVDIEWREVAHDGKAGGSIRLPPLLQLVRPSFAEDDVAVALDGLDFPTRSDGGPLLARTETDRTFLLDLHFLECREGDHWSALRARMGGAMELWYRRDFGLEAPCDLPLRATVGTYIETLLMTRGADSWPLLLLDLDAIPKVARAAIAKYGIPQLRHALDVLGSVERTREDALVLLRQVEFLSKELKRAPLRSATRDTT